MFDYELWWNTVPGARQLTESITDGLVQMESQILYINDRFPWLNEFRLTVNNQILRQLPQSGSAVFDANANKQQDPGQWVLDYFGNGQFFCLPTEDPAQLAISSGLLKNRIIWVLNCNTREQVNSWVQFANLLKRDRTGSSGCIVLLIHREIRGNNGLNTLDPTDYFSEYDLNFFASSIVSRTRQKLFDRKYLTELAVHLSFGSAERCAELALMGKELLRDPMSVTSIASETDSRHAVWKAQIRTFFSSIEETKYELLQQNKDAVQPLLGMEDEYHNVIEQLEDIELRHLIYAEKKDTIVLPKKTSEKISLLYRSRNELAHHRSLPYDELETLEKIL